MRASSAPCPRRSPPPRRGRPPALTRPPRRPRPLAPPPRPRPPLPRPPPTPTTPRHWGGSPPSAFLVSCPAATSLYGGVCWDNASRTAAGWLTASDICGNAGGRLPTLSELVAYTDQPGTQVTAGHWSSDVADPAGGTPIVGVRDEASHFFTGSGSFAYRCVFYRTN